MAFINMGLRIRGNRGKGRVNGRGGIRVSGKWEMRGKNKGW